MTRSRHWLFAGAAVLLVVLLRFVVSSPADLEVFDQFEAKSGLDVGPRAEFFSYGLRGDAATFTIIAVDPLGQGAGHLLDASSYRYSRYAYPIVARAVVLGNDQWILAGLAAVGLAAVAFNAYASSYLRERVGWRAWLLVCNPALIVGAISDIAEPLALAFLTFSILTGSLTLAMATTLARPSYLVALRTWRARLFGALVAFVTWVYWGMHFGKSVSEDVSFGLGPPFTGFLEKPSLLGGLVVAAATVTLVIGVRRRDLAWILSALLIFCLSAAVFENPLNAIRASGMLPVLWVFGPGFSDTVSLSEVFGLRRRGLQAEDRITAS